MGRRWKVPIIEWSYAWEETISYILFYYKWSHVWHVGVVEKLFHYQVSNVWRHWWHSRSHISHEPADILLTCSRVCRGLDGSTCSESLGDWPLWTPRARAPDLGQGPNVRAGSGRAPWVPRCREHEKRPAAGREKSAEGPKKHLYI